MIHPQRAQRRFRSRRRTSEIVKALTLTALLVSVFFAAMVHLGVDCGMSCGVLAKFDLPNFTRENGSSSFEATGDRAEAQGRQLSSLYGQKLSGVDVYVVEREIRKDIVRAQVEEHEVPGGIVSVSAYTPETESVRDEITSIKKECLKRAEKGDAGLSTQAGMHVRRKDAKVSSQQLGLIPRTRGAKKGFKEDRSYDINAKEIAVTLSHLKALQQACSAKKPQGIALVFEDDANFGPMKWWPMPLTEMLSHLPQNWTIVNAAQSNYKKIDPDGFDPPSFFRPRLGGKRKLDIDWGATAVVYNVGNPWLCSKIEGMSPVDFLLRGADNMCQPADWLLYKEFGGEHGAYSAKLPLFYFSKGVENPEKDAVNNHTVLVEHAEEQRKAWDQYVTRRNKHSKNTPDQGVASMTLMDSQKDGSSQITTHSLVHIDLLEKQNAGSKRKIRGAISGAPMTD